ncbi:MAG: AAA domain-containing protein [Parvularculales bacterium]
MINIEGYELQKDPILEFRTADAGFQKAKDVIFGDGVEILWIRRINTDRSENIDRAFRTYKSLPLHNNYSLLRNIQRPRDFIQNEHNDYSYIVYDQIEESAKQKFNKQDFKQAVVTLDKLFQEHQVGLVLDHSTVVKDKDNKIKFRFIGLTDLIHNKIITFQDIEPDNRTMKDDIISLSDLFCDYLNSTYPGNEIYKKCQSGKYETYPELLEEIAELPAETEEVPDTYDDVNVAVNDNKHNLEHLLEELNSGCWWLKDTKKSNKGEHQIIWSNENESGLFIVKPDRGDESCGHLFLKCKKDKPAKNILRCGVRAEHRFITGMGLYECEPLPDVSALPLENSVDHESEPDQQILSSPTHWRSLSEHELKHKDENALRIKYARRRQCDHNKENIIFTLDDDFDDWKKLSDKKYQSLCLLIDDLEIGKIASINKSKKEIVIKDFKKPAHSIPPAGVLTEDIHTLLNPYHKEIRASDRLMDGEVVYPVLVDYFVNPENPPKSNFGNTNSMLTGGNDFKPMSILNDSQVKAVKSALDRKKPIHLIQGPPGTGKTKVIVEIIQQLTTVNKNIKILIASQSNTAVDNVFLGLDELEKNGQIGNTKFARLLSKIKSENTNANSDICANHVLDVKFKNWIRKTEEKSRNNFTDKFSNATQALALLYKDFQNKKINNIKQFRQLYQKNSFGKSYYDKIFANADNLEEVKEIFNKELGSDFTKLQGIHSDWIAFINRATTIDKSKKKFQSASTIKQGGYDTGLDTAFGRTMNVFGSTCIHIDSSRYREMHPRFDVLIMDESGKATNSEALVPLVISNKAIFVGDHKQLRPMITKHDDVKDGVREDLDEDLDFDKTYGPSAFERLYNGFRNANLCDVFMTRLDVQYRMPRHIGNLISENFYRGKLNNPSEDNHSGYNDEKNHHIPLRTPFVRIMEYGKEVEVQNSIILISTSKNANRRDTGGSKNRHNPHNVQVINATLQQLSHLHNDNNEIPNEVGIIAGYRCQVKHLNMMKQKYHRDHGELNIKIQTVDGFQGSEQDIIIYDLVRSNTRDKSIGFLDDHRRINVAFSRAKKLLIIVGDSEHILNDVVCRKGSEIQNRDDLHLVQLIKQLRDCNCIYQSFEEVIDHDRA